MYHHDGLVVHKITLRRLHRVFRPRCVQIQRILCNKVKVYFYIAQTCIQSVGPLKAIYTSPPGRPVLYDSNSTSLESILATQQLLRENYSLTFPLLNIARYSFLQLSELGLHGENESESAQTLKRQQRWIQTQALLIASPAFYH